MDEKTREKGRGMNVTIDVSDYLDERDMREIAREQFALAVKERIGRGGAVDAMIANIAHRTVWEAVDDIIGEDAKALIAAKVPDVIRDISTYTVFREEDNSVFRRDASAGQKILEEVVAENRPLIEHRVREIINGISQYTLRDEIREAIDETVSEWLFKTEDTRRD